MEYIYAALLLHNSGKEVTEEGITALMGAAGIKVDKGRVKALISALSGVNIDEAIAQAQPVYAPAAMAPPVMPAEVPVPEAKEAEKKEKKEKKGKEGEEEEKAEKTGMQGLAALFG
jgi:large subunit ribosomal protein L12